MAESGVKRDACRIFARHPGNHLLRPPGPRQNFNRAHQPAEKSLALRFRGKNDARLHAGGIARAEAKLAVGGQARDLPLGLGDKPSRTAILM